MVDILLQDTFSFARQEEDQLLAEFWEQCRTREDFLAAVRDLRRRKPFFLGHIRVIEHPEDMPLDEYLKWWASLTEGEQKRYKEGHIGAETHNLLTINGRTQLLSYIGSNAAVNAPFAQYWAVGSFPVTMVSAGDASVQGEFFRQVPNSSIVSGTQVDIQTVIGNTSAVGSWTNCGLFGLSASSSTGSGTLMTHALLVYTKANNFGVTIDYVINIT